MISPAETGREFVKQLGAEGQGGRKTFNKDLVKGGCTFTSVEQSNLSRCSKS